MHINVQLDWTGRSAEKVNLTRSMRSCLAKSIAGDINLNVEMHDRMSMHEVKATYMYRQRPRIHTQFYSARCPAAIVQQLSRQRELHSEIRRSLTQVNKSW